MVYRSADDALRRRRDELIGHRQLEVLALPEAVSAVYVRRRARADAGIMGIAAAAALVLAAALRQGGLTTILHVAWASMAAVYLVSRLSARRKLAAVLAHTYSPTGSAEDDLLRLGELHPARVVKDLADAIEWRSVTLPMTALAMLLPLSLHYLFVLAVRLGVPDAADFDGWISLSLLCVGHCHVVLAAQVWRFAERVRVTGDVFSVGLLADRSGWHAWGLTIASSVVAGMLLLAVIPVAGIAVPSMVVPLAISALVVVAPAVVAVTGLAFIPPMFSRMGKKVREERLLLAYPAYCRRP
jgi:hypothetical protein